MSDKEEIIKNLTGAYALEKPLGNNQCAVYQLISTEVRRSHTKTIEVSKYQFDCYGETLKQSRGVAKAVKEALDLNTTDFVISYLENDFYIKEDNLYRTILEFRIW
jgi:5-formaminoimidazole-4-carboxamide-1-beta-D-ribofuranosyl 5'-monophosphate synthetase